MALHVLISNPTLKTNYFVFGDVSSSACFLNMGKDECNRTCKSLLRCFWLMLSTYKSFLLWCRWGLSFRFVLTVLLFSIQWQLPHLSIAQELDEIYRARHLLHFIPIEQPKILLKEKQISFYPISFRGPSMGEISFNLLLPPKHNFLSCSLPTSSPRFGKDLEECKSSLSLTGWKVGE